MDSQRDLDEQGPDKQDDAPQAAEPAPLAPDAGLGDHATGDIVIDSALQDLRNAPDDDLDAQVEAGRRVHQTLHGRLSDLGGE